jgi:hypothetical protein
MLLFHVDYTYNGERIFNFAKEAEINILPAI